MLIDSRLEFSDAQALTVTAASTNVIDLESARQVGVGEVLYVVLTVDVALGGTSPTVDAVLQTDDNSGFSSAATVAAFKQLTDAAGNPGATAGSMIWIAIPNHSVERYLRINYTLTGTSPTATLSAFVTNQEPFDHTAYPDAVN